MYLFSLIFFFFFFNDTATTEIYTLSLHDALPIFTWLKRIGRDAVLVSHEERPVPLEEIDIQRLPDRAASKDRKSTRLNSSHSQISYAVFCLKKKKTTKKEQHIKT